MKKRKNYPVIIDTDPGHDDALAIMLLVKSGAVDIQAVTTVAGNGGIENVTNNARFILDLVGSSVPVYSGADRPLVRPLVKAEVHGESAMDGVKIVKQEPLTGDAAERMIRIIRANPGQVTVLTIGPQTNLAAALRKDPGIAQMIRRVVMMAGAIAVPGNKNRVAEFNVFVDPEAAAVVMDSPIPKLMVPLDVCNVVPLFESDFEKLKGCGIYEPVTAMMRAYMKGIEKFEKTRGALMYDVLAAYYLLNPSAYRTEIMDVRVETAGEYTRGMTIADRRNWGDRNPNVEVVVGVDRDVFVRDFLSVLKRG